MLSLGVLEITISSWAAPGHRMTICLASLGPLLRISVGRYSAGRGRLAPELRYQLGESKGYARLRAADPAGRDAGEVRHATGGGEAGRVAPGPPDRLLCFPKQALPQRQRLSRGAPGPGRGSGTANASCASSRWSPGSSNPWTGARRCPWTHLARSRAGGDEGGRKLLGVCNQMRV